MSYKDVYTNMIEKCYTIYQQTQMLIKIIEKVGENEDTLTKLVNDTINNVNQIVNELNTRVDNIDQTLLNLKYDKNNEIYNFLKSIKINGHILNVNETFDVDGNGNLKCNNASVNSVIYKDGSVGATAKPKMYRHRITISGRSTWSYGDSNTAYVYFDIYNTRSNVYNKTEILNIISNLLPIGLYRFYNVSGQDKLGMVVYSSSNNFIEFQCAIQDTQNSTRYARFNLTGLEYYDNVVEI